MKTLALALLIPIAFCTACGNREEPMATSAPAPVDAAGDAPASVNAPANPPAPVAAAEPAPLTAHTSLTSVAGRSVQGGLTVVNQGSGVSIRGEITGLAPGKDHGFHLHEVGECTLPNFASAGAHFNPTEAAHGGPESTDRHLGDLPNAKADADGRALIDVNVEGVTFVDKDGAPTEILGKSIVVHALPDDFKTQPSGGSGDRIACGVIR
ncbi:MAG TPA: superoxide dismutase family protein [Steroidobacteraceae bacterium]|nr:superoxide dismutase family protein [Steroidobacteraceae bacterium]